MGLLKYQCIICGRYWGQEDAPDEETSHGYCPRCLRDRQKYLVRKAQNRQGYQACYARGYGDCTEQDCLYWKVCMETEIQEWERQNIDHRKKPS